MVANTHKKIAVVTGGASGLGLAAACKLVASGVAVAIWDHNAAALEAAREAMAHAGAVLTCEVDVANPEAVERAALRTQTELGHPHMLIAAAGVAGPVLPFMEWSLKDWQRVIDINLTGVHLTCQALIPAMVRAAATCAGSIGLIRSRNANVAAATTARPNNTLEGFAIDNSDLCPFQASRTFHKCWDLPGRAD